MFTKAGKPDTPDDKGLTPQTRERLLGETSHSTDVSSMRSFWGLVSAYWKSDEKYKAIGLLAVGSALTCAEIYLGVEMMKWAGDFINVAISHKGDMMHPDVIDQAQKFIGISAGTAAVWNLRYYLERLLIVGWRGWLTEKFGDAALSNKSFFHISNSKTVPNMDQRLAEDPDVLVSQIVELYTGGLRSVLSLGLVTHELYKMTGSMPLDIMGRTWAAPSPFFWASFGTALACAVMGIVSVRKFGAPSVSLGENYVRAQGEMRKNLTNMFEHSSEIASYNDQNVERNNLKHDFDKVRTAWKGYEKMQAKMQALQGIMNDLSRLGAWIVGGVSYGLGYVSTAGAMVTYGNLVDRLRDSLAWPMTISQSVFRIQTRANLLMNFATEIELSKDPQHFYSLHGKDANIAIKEESGESIILRDLALKDSVRTDPIMRVPFLEIKKGERIMLTGPSGSGKSLLIRAMGGLWKHGEGEITLPAGQSRMFVPQAAYVMNNMTLKENVIYPDCDPEKYSDDDVAEALRLAELDYLVPHLKDSSRNDTSWGNLSPGEKQRLIFARIFLHKPDMVFLDEATSGLDAALQDRMYRRLNEILPDAIVVSIAHRDGLMAYHTRHLEVNNGGLEECNSPFPGIYARYNYIPPSMGLQRPPPH